MEKPLLLSSQEIKRFDSKLTLLDTTGINSKSLEKLTTEYSVLDDGSQTFGAPQARIAILLADHRQYKMLGPNSG